MLIALGTHRFYRLEPVSRHAPGTYAVVPCGLVARPIQAASSPLFPLDHDKGIDGAALTVPRRVTVRDTSSCPRGQRARALTKDGHSPAMNLPTLSLEPEQLLTTTRAVRKRLDFDREVPLTLIRHCLQVALQAPTASHSESWRFLIVKDASQRAELAKVYRRAFARYRDVPGSVFARAEEAPAASRGTYERVGDSADYLTENLHRVPVLLVACVEGRPDMIPRPLGTAAQASAYASIYPALWSFMLAARLHGLGSVLTTAHLLEERAAAEVLGIPFEKYTQCGLLPIAYTKGSNFSPAPRKPVEQVAYLDDWGEPFAV